MDFLWSGEGLTSHRPLPRGEEENQVNCVTWEVEKCNGTDTRSGGIYSEQERSVAMIVFLPNVEMALKVVVGL